MYVQISCLSTHPVLAMIFSLSKNFLSYYFFFCTLEIQPSDSKALLLKLCATGDSKQGESWGGGDELVLPLGLSLQQVCWPLSALITGELKLIQAKRDNKAALPPGIPSLRKGRTFPGQDSDQSLLWSVLPNCLTSSCLLFSSFCFLLGKKRTHSKTKRKY